MSSTYPHSQIVSDLMGEFRQHRLEPNGRDHTRGLLVGEDMLGGYETHRIDDGAWAATATIHPTRNAGRGRYPSILQVTSPTADQAVQVLRERLRRCTPLGNPMYGAVENSMTE
jgi:hypothetical protein